MSDAIRTDADLTPDAESMDLPVFDTMLSPIRKPVRAKTVRTASRETGDAFDRAFAALEEALRERDESLAKPIAKTVAAPLMFPTSPELTPAPELKIEPIIVPKPVAKGVAQPVADGVAAPTAFFMPKYVAPQVMPTGQHSAPSASFVAPGFERIAVQDKAEANAPIIQSAAPSFERVDAILAQMQQAAQEVMQGVAAVALPEACIEETIVFVEANEAASKSMSTSEADLMPFGMASLRMMVM